MQASQINELNLDIPNFVDNNFNQQQYFLNDIDQEGPLSEEEELQNLQNAQKGYITDSDIDDPKYIPTGNNPEDEDNLNLENFNNIDNFENIGIPSQNQIFLQNEIMNLENNSIITNKKLQQLESEHDALKVELMKNKEKMNSKEGIYNEFRNFIAAFRQRAAQYEIRSNYLEKYVNELEEKLKNKDIEFNESLKDRNKSEAALKNASIYKQYMDELQNEFKEQSKKLNEKYNNKEKNLKNEFIKEINSNMKRAEELRVENENLKYDLSNYKINIENLNNKLEEKTYDKESIINLKDNDIIFKRTNK